jgi:hypothetical protein
LFNLTLFNTKESRNISIITFLGEDPRLIVTPASEEEPQRLFVVSSFRSEGFQPEIIVEYAEVMIDKTTKLPYFQNSTFYYINLLEEDPIEDYQKNWIPFVPAKLPSVKHLVEFHHNHPLLYVHSIHPHRIVEVSIIPNTSFSSSPSSWRKKQKNRNRRDRKKQSSVASSTDSSSSSTAIDLSPSTIEKPNAVWGRTIANTADFIPNWPYGHLRGGTPAILINNSFYLTFFHSSTEPVYPDVNKTYVMGAYTFCPTFPYSILAMSPYPIIHQSMYEGKWPYMPFAVAICDYIVFPMSFFLINDSLLYLTYGKQDVEGWIAKMDISELLKSLVLTKNRCEPSSAS